ncbi:MAG TPA: tail fiber domain-containing protein, partial [Candidatus Paceibacterota bacterium]|nr:tail fiber domain-containing protein [Candidatus Paceibacterota bacterium]
YNWNSEADNTLKHTGFIAQNLEQIFPDLVTTDEDKMKGVNYAGMTPYLVSAIKELNQKVDSGGIFAHLVASEDLSTEEAGLNFIELVKRALEKLSEIFINTKLWVESLRAEKVETKELCIDGICVTKEQLQGMLDSSGIIPKTTVAPMPDLIPEPAVEPTPAPEQTTAPTPAPEQTTAPTPASEQTTAPTPASEQTPESISEPTPDPIPESESTPSYTEEAPTSS